MVRPGLHPGIGPARASSLGTPESRHAPWGSYNRSRGLGNSGVSGPTDADVFGAEKPNQSKPLQSPHPRSLRRCSLTFREVFPYPGGTENSGRNMSQYARCFPARNWPSAAGLTEIDRNLYRQNESLFSACQGSSFTCAANDGDCLSYRLRGEPRWSGRTHDSW